MSEFAVRVRPILDIFDHPNADRLSIVKIDGYDCISAKLDDGSHRYQIGDLVAYIPEASVMPSWLLQKMDFWKDGKGTLNGSAGNRVKAIRLRQIFSQGILYPVKNNIIETETGTQVVSENDDVAEYLGITKYEPPVPSHMGGEVSSNYQFRNKFDIENIQTFPEMFEESDYVIVTEKLHGTHCRISYIPDINDDDLFFDGNVCVASKGLGAKGLVFKRTNEENLYVQVLKSFLNDYDAMSYLKTLAVDGPVHILGEVFGIGVQDLGYGMTTKQFRVFAIKFGETYVPYDQLVFLTKNLNLELVPLLYSGPFCMQKMTELRDGQTSYNTKQIREGIVITTIDAKIHPKYGYKIAKYVSPDYLLRKGNTTEYT